MELKSSVSSNFSYVDWIYLPSDCKWSHQKLNYLLILLIHILFTDIGSWHQIFEPLFSRDLVKYISNFSQSTTHPNNSVTNVVSCNESEQIKIKNHVVWQLLVSTSVEHQTNDIHVHCYLICNDRPRDISSGQQLTSNW